ncbi:MAG TPA: Stk1 family PASTA domain-containing Ser/Thr kinase [Solirubrobacteraceae bacterium]
MTRLATGAVIDGRYRIIGHLGTGGMAEVYCAHDEQLERKVALKLLHERFAADEEFVERFRREASSAAGLQHQYVVSVYDRGEYDGTPYIAMEYVDGRTLKQLVRENGPLDPTLAADFTIQILRAARFAHRRGVIHRDFKPQNVIVDDEGRAKVTDFGIARAGASDMTQTGSIMGTAQYLSPEQAQGHAVNARSDLYSIGIILYELLTGRVPFDAESAVTVALKQVSETPIAPRRLNPAVTPELEAIVLRALEKDPADRFADADEFIAALEAAASRIPTASVIAAAEAAAASLPVMVGPPLPRPPVQSAAGPPTLTGTSRMLPVDPHQIQQPASPQRPPVPRRRRKRWPYLLAVAVAAAILIPALILSAAPKRVQVPGVVGSTISVATQKLRSEGFAVAVVRDSSDKPRNTVYGQDPAGGTTADKGAKVTINVSEGQPITKVPDVMGLGHAAARKLLTAAGFTVDEQPTPSATVVRNHVIAQNPSGNSQAEKGQKVTIQVSSGPQLSPVPDVTGKSEDDARAALNGAGFTNVTVVGRDDAKADPGTVLEQSPAADAGPQPTGTEVTITVATAPTSVKVQDVTGTTQNKATETLSGQGLKVVPQDMAVDSPDEDGLVQSQDPAAGSKVDAGSSVTIKVGVFDPSLDPEPTTTTPPATTTAPAPPP